MHRSSGLRKHITAATLVALLLVSWSLLVAHGDEYENEDYENEIAEALGETALTLGIPLTLVYVAYKTALPTLARHGITRIVSPRLALKLHAITSLALGLLAAAHGLLLIDRAGPIEIALGVTLAITLISGTSLYLLLGTRHARKARLIHAQRLLALALLVLALIHATLRD